MGPRRGGDGTAAAVVSAIERCSPKARSSGHCGRFVEDAIQRRGLRLVGPALTLPSSNVLGMTRQEVARRSGVSAGTISRLADPATKRCSRITVSAVLAIEP